MNTMHNPYGELALSQAYRILGLGDRYDESPTKGCFDRYYWHYRQIDFVNARFQEACHFLALLYVYDHPTNRFYQKERIREWAMAAVSVWESIQRSDGSFEEYWPFERSFCATSFTTYAACEACLRLECAPPEWAIRKACAWLAKRENSIVVNQMAASAVALKLASILLNDDAIRLESEKRMETVLSLQDEAGYFPEYGGYDIGYLTITLSCLAQYYNHTKEKQVQDAMNQGVRFLEDKIYDNGSYDYKNTSRQSQYFYPFGFRVMEEWDLLAKHQRGLEREEVIHPGWCDDRYCLPLAIDYLQTAVYDHECLRE